MSRPRRVRDARLPGGRRLPHGSRIGPARQDGFTLVEVLVALALMAIISLVSWRGLDSVLRTREHVERGAERDDALLRVLGQLERDVQAHAPGYVLQGSAGGEQEAGRRPPALPVSIAVTGSDDGHAQLEIVRGPVQGGWQRVRWWRDGTVLRRALAPAGDSLPLPEPGSGDAVLDGVSGFGVQAWIPGKGWLRPPLPASSPSATGLAFVVELSADGAYRRVVALQ